MIRQPAGKKQAGHVGLRGPKTLSQRGQGALPAIEHQNDSFEDNEHDRGGGLSRVAIRNTAVEDVKNASAQEKENRGMEDLDGKNQHGERIDENVLTSEK